MYVCVASSLRCSRVIHSQLADMLARMCVCTCMYTCTCIYIYTHIYAKAEEGKDMMGPAVYVCLYVCVCIYTYTHIQTNVSIYTYTYTYTQAKAEEGKDMMGPASAATEELSHLQRQVIHNTRYIYAYIHAHVIYM